MTDDAASEHEGTLENDTPIDLETVETRLQTVDDQLETLLVATDDLEAAGTLRRRIAETRTELLTIRHEFEARCPDSSESGANESPPAVTRGGTVHTILGP